MHTEAGSYCVRWAAIIGCNYNVCKPYSFYYTRSIGFVAFLMMYKKSLANYLQLF